MYQTCPKCQHARTPEDESDPDVCPRCGLVFSKYLKTKFRTADKPPARRAHRGGGGRARLGQWLLPEIESPPAAATVHARAALWLIFAVWGVRLVWIDMESNAIGASFLHNVHLMFHEAGHALFRPFGRFMSYLGGSLMQLIVPGVFLVAFLWKQRDAFAASIALWWFGTSLMDLAPYINDARAMRLMLLGGGTGRDRPGMHDWNEILGDLGLLAWDHRLASFVDVLGEATVLAAVAWGGAVLWRQYRWT